MVFGWYAGLDANAPDLEAASHFGELLASGKLLYGRPAAEATTGYFDMRYRSLNVAQREPFNNSRPRAFRQGCVTDKGINPGAVRNMLQQKV